MADFSVRIEQIDQLLQDDPVEGFRSALSLLEPPPVDSCHHGRALDSFGTACRVFGDLARAEEAFGKAAGLCRCKRCWWDRLRRITYLRAEQGDLKAGRELAEKAISGAPNRAMAGRCRVAAAYVRLVAKEHEGAVQTARQALEELDPSDILYSIGAVTTIGFCSIHLAPARANLLHQAREDLRELRRRWPRNRRYRSARAKASMVAAVLGYRLRELEPWQLRAILTRVQRLHVELGMWRDAVQLTAETTEICSEMRRWDLVARTIEVMLDALPASLPRHVTTAVQRLRQSLEAVDRREVTRAATELRGTLVLRPSPVL